MPAKLTTEEIKRRIESLLNRNIQLLETYTKVRNHHKFKCLTCNHKWTTTFSKVYNKNQGCKKCAYKKLAEQFSISPEEKVKSDARIKLRKRLTKLYYRKGLRHKPYHDPDFYKALFPFWEQQFSSFIRLNPKPTNGSWHLDHIIPLSWFDPHSVDEMKLCWNRQNLQWLTHLENSTKRDQIRPEDIAKFTSWHWEALKKCSYPKKLPA